MPETPSKWPTVVGILGIVLASLGFVGGCCALGNPFYMGFFIDMMANSPNAPKEQVELMKASQMPAAWMIMAGLIGIGMSVLLLVGAINVVRRRAKGVGLCKTWAWINMPWAVISLMVGLAFQMRIPPELQQVSGAWQYIGLAFGGCMTLVFGIGVPIFFLAWFSRQTIRDEIAAWSDEAQQVI